MAADAELVGQVIVDNIPISKMVKEDFIDDWILVRTPYPVAIVLTTYLLVVFKVGPYFMRNRKPLELETTMRIYNVFQMLINAYQFYSIAGNRYVMSCIIEMSCSFSSHEHFDELRYAYLTYSWNYYVTKMVDLLDTVFMVLRKKNANITFLHVYHHAAMVFFVWATLYFTQSHHATFPGMVNTFVHTIMYAYYFLATFPALKKYLWWKQHLTKLQLNSNPETVKAQVVLQRAHSLSSQFAVILLYIFLLYHNGCQISQAFSYMWLFNVTVIFALFINFYIKSYVFSKKRNHS